MDAQGKRRGELELIREGAVLRGTATGDGPTVLLLHAGGERRTVWEPVARALAQGGVRSVAFDQRGHGDSSGEPTSLATLAGDVDAMIRQQRRPVTIVGASIGGLAALDALADRATASHVRGLVLVDVVPDPDPVRARAWLDAHGLRRRREALVDDVLARGPTLRATLAALDLPILLVRGGAGSPLSDAEVVRLQETNPRVRVEQVHEAGHLIARDAPERLAAIILGSVSADAEMRARELMAALGAGDVTHPGGTLLAHLERVHRLTVDWGASPRTRLAALGHATYGTHGFPHALLPVTDRNRLRAVIGVEAEELVYRYGACDRAAAAGRWGQAPLPWRDRFTGATTELADGLLGDFAVLSIANELDVVRHGSLPRPVVDEIRALLRALAVHAPDEASSALEDPALS